jgi:arylsulfatase A-like enzyme
MPLPSPARNLDVLLITIDQWRADSLSCAGHPCARTPNIDALAARGVRFAQHYAQCAPCGPSRASLLTGTYLHVHRSVGNGTPLDARLTNVALELRAAGYDPTLFGYTDSTVDVRTVDDPDDWRLRTYEGVLPGFHAEVYLPEHLEAWGDWLRERGVDAPTGEVREAMYRQRDDVEGHDDHGSTWAPTVYAAEHSEAAFLTERFGRWLDAQPDGRALFAHVTYIRPHPPYMAPAPWHDLIDPADVPAPVRHPDPETEGARQHPMVAAALRSGLAHAPTDDREMRQLQATYWGMLAEVDDQIGALIRHVERCGRADRTLVILTADHGEQLGDHWLLDKLLYFDASYHIPLVVAGPNIGATAAGRVVDEFTENIDLMPTILDLVGLPVPAQCQGATLRPFLEGGSPSSWRNSVHWEWDFRSVGSTRLEERTGLTMAQCNLAVHRDRHAKYVHFAGMPPAFYDLDADPDELADLADDPAHAHRVAEFAQRLLSWRMGTDDETLAGTLVTPFGVIERRSPVAGTA